MIYSIEDFGSAPRKSVSQFHHGAIPVLSEIDDHHIVPAVDDHAFGLEGELGGISIEVYVPASSVTIQEPP